MRSTLHIKFIALYIIFGFLCLFSTATLTEQLVTDKLTEDTSHTLYREATFVANDYLPSYFSGDSSIYNVQSQLSAMRLYFNASIWFVDSTGRTLTSSSLEDTVCPDRIKDFNPADNFVCRDFRLTCDRRPKMTLIDRTKLTRLTFHYKTRLRHFLLHVQSNLCRCIPDTLKKFAIICHHSTTFNRRFVMRPCGLQSIIR